MRFVWHAEKFVADLRRDLTRRLTKVGLFLASKIRTNINTAQPYKRSRGGRNYHGYGPSAPGQFPHKLSGQLLKSVTWSVDEKNLTVTVGSNLAGYPKFLETGTRYMQPRPWLSRTLENEAPNVGRLLAGEKV